MNTRLLNSFRRSTTYCVHAVSLLFITIVTLSCEQQGRQPAQVRVNDTLAFQVIDLQTGRASNLKCYGVITTQSLHLTDDRWEDKVMNDERTFELVTAEGNRSAPLVAENRQIIFKPIHSRQLFQRSGLRGDLNAVYDLSIHTKERVSHYRLLADTALLHRSLDSLGLSKRVALYQLDALPSGHVSENEILDEGFWIKINAHWSEDTLRVNGRIVNQTGKEIDIEPSKVIVNTGIEFQPAKATTRMTIPNGSRGEFALSFPTDRAASFYLKFDAALEKHKPRVLSNGITFKTAKSF